MGISSSPLMGWSVSSHLAKSTALCLIQEMTKAIAFSSTFWYIDDSFKVNNKEFENYIKKREWSFDSSGCCILRTVALPWSTTVKRPVTTYCKITSPQKQRQDTSRRHWINEKSSPYMSRTSCYYKYTIGIRQYTSKSARTSLWAVVSLGRTLHFKEKPLRATVWFSIKRARPCDAHVKTSLSLVLQET